MHAHHLPVDRAARAALLALMLLASACAGPGLREGGAGTGVEVPEPGAPASARLPQQDSAVRAAPGSARAHPAPDAGAPWSQEGVPDPGYSAPPPSANSAVNTLLAQADQARRGGDLDAAIAAAERALRIAPADPVVYYQLAALRIERGDYALAGQLARKGLSQRPDPELRMRLEELLERARRASTG